MTWSRRPLLKGGADWTDADYLADLKSKCLVTPTGCWEWQRFRFKPPRHYGSTSYRGKKMMTHKMAYIVAKGPVPKGLCVLHSCDNPPCCNPDHLRLGTHLENMADCRAKNRYYYANLTHCKHGHEFTPENTYIIPTPGPSQGLRACKVCMKLRAQTPERKAKDRERARRRRERTRLLATSGSTVSEKP